MLRTFLTPSALIIVLQKLVIRIFKFLYESLQLLLTTRLSPDLSWTWRETQYRERGSSEECVQWLVVARWLKDFVFFRYKLALRSYDTLLLSLSICFTMLTARTRIERVSSRDRYAFLRTLFKIWESIDWSLGEATLEWNSSPKKNYRIYHFIKIRNTVYIVAIRIYFFKHLLYNNTHV